jgi:hypothetical protein
MSTLNEKRTEPLICDSEAEFHSSLDDRLDNRLNVTVIFTTPEGTVAALKSAADLSTQLGARLTLLVAEAVPIHFSLDRPHVSIDFLQRRSWALVYAAGIVDEEVKIQICLCRNRRLALKSMLAPHALVVIGGRPHWWRTAERKLQNFLRRLGHQVIWVESEKQSRPQAETAWQATFLRALEIMEMKGPHI